MTRGEDGVYHASIDAHTPVEGAAGAVKFWMESGDGRLDPMPVAVVQRLTIKQVEAQIIAPPYSQLPPQLVNLSQNSATMTLGSKVKLRAVFNKPLDPKIPISVELLTEKAKPKFEWDGPAGTRLPVLWRRVNLSGFICMQLTPMG